MEAFQQRISTVRENYIIGETSRETTLNFLRILFPKQTEDEHHARLRQWDIEAISIPTVIPDDDIYPLCTDCGNRIVKDGCYCHKAEPFYLWDASKPLRYYGSALVLGIIIATIISGYLNQL